jgi:hydroxymethylbilane synthase
MRNLVRIGTRGSQLALAQTNQIIEALKRASDGVRCEVVPIRTKGDKMQESAGPALEGKSVFTAEIEETLLKGRVDMAVHSMKDLNTDMTSGIVIGGVPERANPRDVLISRGKVKFQQLQGEARVGTSSPRRKAQLLAARGDLQVIEVHGNVDTRLRKLERGECDAIVLAAAGLTRLGLEKYATEFLSTDIMLPAVGQGALAVQCREDDDEVRELLSQIDHESTRRAVEAERAFARKLGANCRTPIAAYARVESEGLAIDGLIAAASGRLLLRSRIISDNPSAERVGEELADALLKKGAAAVLEAA